MSLHSNFLLWSSPVLFFFQQGVPDSTGRLPLLQDRNLRVSAGMNRGPRQSSSQHGQECGRSNDQSESEELGVSLEVARGRGASQAWSQVW